MKKIGVMFGLVVCTLSAIAHAVNDTSQLIHGATVQRASVVIDLATLIVLMTGFVGAAMIGRKRLAKNATTTSSRSERGSIAA